MSRSKTNRLKTHAKLLEICPNVYFKPPTTLMYPCIIYRITRDRNQHGDDIKYIRYNAYELTLITKDPDEPISDLLVDKFELINFNNAFHSNNLYHRVYQLFI